MSAPEPPPVHATSRHGVGFWLGLVIGAGCFAVGVRYALDPATGANGHVAVRWLIGLLVGHDFVVVPLVGVSGWLLGKVLPQWAVGPVRGAAAMSAILTVFTWPLVRRYGASHDNPSKLPYHSYGENLLIVLAVVWAWALLLVVVRWRTSASRRRTTPPT